MKTKNTTLLLLILITIGFSISSCDKKDEDQTFTQVCMFEQNDNTLDGQIDETERTLMENCFADRLTEATEIRNNLIGEWQLIGHGEGWIQSISQPCGALLITDTEITLDYEDRNIDTITVHSWELETVDINTPEQVSHRIKMEPTPHIWLQFSVFCDHYMYVDATPSDGNMYLFEKVN